MSSTKTLLLLVLLGPAAVWAAAAPPVAAKNSATHANPVCERVRDAVAKHALDNLGDGNIGWIESNTDLPEDLVGAEQAEFDFDNDGTIDRVFRREFSVHYMMGSTLLVQSGRSPNQVDVASGNPADDPQAAFLPCQWDSKPIALHTCPPFTQDNDEAGFALSRRNGKRVFFRARYVELVPFLFQNHSYVAISSHSQDTIDFVGVVQPRADKRFEPACLLHRGRIDNVW